MELRLWVKHNPYFYEAILMDAIGTNQIIELNVDMKRWGYKIRDFGQGWLSQLN